MTRKSILRAAGVGLVFAAGFGVAAYMTSPGGNIIPRNVLGGGGGRSADGAGRVLNSTIGQPATGIMAAGNGTMLSGGFQVMIPTEPSAHARRWQLY